MLKIITPDGAEDEARFLPEALHHLKQMESKSLPAVHHHYPP